ncbi:MAG TPA: type II secretion system protein [Kineosporiaceae bacterium]|nr:type II secretion system protein [Kineosporiaceae bacterium]
MTMKLPKRDDSGFTLVEMIVAMGIFAVLLAIFSTAVQSFSKSTVRSLRTSDQTTQGRVVFNLFDKQVRAASAISIPALSGSSWYVEYLDDTGTAAICTQWVVRTDTDIIATRKWTVGATTAPAWRTVATNVTNSTTQAPFTLIASTTVVPRQRLSVTLRYQRTGGPLTVNNSVFTARNTGSMTSTNTTSGLICNSSTWRS